MTHNSTIRVLYILIAKLKFQLFQWNWRMNCEIESWVIDKERCQLSPSRWVDCQKLWYGNVRQHINRCGDSTMHYVTGTKIIRQKKPTVFDIADYPTKKSSAVFDIPQLTKHIPCPIYAAIGLANKRKPAKLNRSKYISWSIQQITKKPTVFDIPEHWQNTFSIPY